MTGSDFGKVVIFYSERVCVRKSINFWRYDSLDSKEEGLIMGKLSKFKKKFIYKFTVT